MDGVMREIKVRILERGMELVRDLIIDAYQTLIAKIKLDLEN